MALQTVSSLMGDGGAHLNDQLRAAVKELQGLNVTAVAGAAAGTKMDIAALRAEDTLIAVLQGTSGTFVNDTANCTISSTTASGTVTIASVAADDTVTVNSVVYTFKASPASTTQVKWTNGNNNANAAALSAAINAHESRYDGAKARVPAVKATVSNAVVTITALVDGTAGNSITLASSNGTRLAVTGSGTLTNGTNTGGFTSTTNNASKDMLVFWFNKR